MPDILFTSQGRTAWIDTDGSHLQYLALDVADQETWQPCDVFADGRLLLLSMEARRDGPGRPFSEFYHKTPTHIWSYDPVSGDLQERVDEPRLATFQTPQLLLNDGRILVQVVGDEGGQVYNCDLSGADARAITQIGEGLPYGFSLSPDGQRLAYHLASPSGYQIWTSDAFGEDRRRVASHDEYLYFAPQWSPDGSWLAFQACLYQQDAGHDGSDLCVCRPDGSEQRLLTSQQGLWFAASYGPPDRHGSGSNMPQWAPDGTLLASCRLPGSRPPWQYQSERPDVDHFNREFRPDQARGGAQIRRFDITDGSSAALTPPEDAVWDFRQSMSPDGTTLLFCRAPQGDSPTLWVAEADGGNPRPICKGFSDLGLDHPRWIPAQT